jgi:hypothetical protein
MQLAVASSAGFNFATTQGARPVRASEGGGSAGALLIRRRGQHPRRSCWGLRSSSGSRPSAATTADTPSSAT